MYQNDRIPPIPTVLIDYRAEIGEAVLEEKTTLLPPANADAEGAAAVNDTYAKLERFFSAVVSFDKRD
jgi:hypothetical protein